MVMIGKKVSFEYNGDRVKGIIRDKVSMIRPPHCPLEDFYLIETGDSGILKAYRISDMNDIDCIIMGIETTLSTGDTVFYLRNNGIVSCTVETIVIQANYKDGVKIAYELANGHKFYEANIGVSVFEDLTSLSRWLDNNIICE